MPRRKKRFSFLERALKAAGNTATTGVLGDYANFRAGINKANVGVKDPTAYQRVQYGITPFGAALITPATPTDAEKELVTITVWSNTWAKGGGGLSNTELGYDIPLSGMGNDAGYYPPLLLVKSAKGPVQEKTSGIIPSRRYKSYGQKSYSIPFGQRPSEVGGSEEYTRFNQLSTPLLALATVGSTSYVPEEWNKESVTVAPGN